MLSTKEPPQNKGHMQTESEGLEEEISCKWRPIENRSSNSISDKIDFEIKAMKRDKEAQYVMVEGSTQEEDITIINRYAPNIAPQYARQMLTSMKGEINSNTILVGNFNTPLTPMDRSTKQKISKETQL